MESPQLIYLILVIPSVFGLTLIVHGLTKIIKNDDGGYINFIFGLVFLGVVAFTYFFFSVYLNNPF
jgi:uncharacterized membrane protein YphA (DoxX/SURF4 family)